MTKIITITATRGSISNLPLIISVGKKYLKGVNILIKLPFSITSYIMLNMKVTKKNKFPYKFPFSYFLITVAIYIRITQ